MLVTRPGQRGIGRCARRLPAADEQLLGELTKRCRTSGLELASGISSAQAAAASASAVTVLTGGS